MPHEVSEPVFFLETFWMFHSSAYFEILVKAQEFVVWYLYNISHPLQREYKVNWIFRQNTEKPRSHPKFILNYDPLLLTCITIWALRCYSNLTYHALSLYCVLGDNLPSVRRFLENRDKFHQRRERLGEDKSCELLGQFWRP